ncbi:MAG: 50S ribosomal protein L9 [Haliangium ochraceum]
MQVILREDMDNLGKSGDVVTVRPGYGRNYLIPQGHAVAATEADVARVAHEKRVIAARNSKLAKEAQSEADRLNQVSVSIPVSVGEEDKMYGSVTARDISEALREKGVTVETKSLVLGEPLKALGLTEVPVKLGRGVTATIKVWVVKKA